MAVKAFIISLKEATDRQAYIMKHLSDFGFEYELVEAVDGRKFDVVNHPEYDKERRLSYAGRNLYGGELGCFFSHRKVLERIVELGLPHALIVEDDLVLSEGFDRVIAALENNPIPYDMVRFLGKPKVAKMTQRFVCEVIDGVYLSRLSTTPGETHAQLVTLEGAKKLLSHMDKIAFPVDAFYGRAWEHGLEWFCLMPGMAIQDPAVKSDITNKRFDKTLHISGFAKAIFPLRRIWHKVCEMCGKRSYYWGNYFKDRAYRKKFGVTK